MADRIVSVDVKVRLKLKVEEGIPVNDSIGNLSCNFSYSTEEVEIVDTEIQDWYVVNGE